MTYVILPLVMCLAGCIKLLPEAPPPAQKLWIETHPATTGKIIHQPFKQYKHVQLLIEEPHLSTNLNSTKIRVVEGHQSFSIANYLKGYEWPISLGEMISEQLIQYFAAHHQFFSVLPFEAPNKGTHKFGVTLSRFDLDFTSSPILKVAGQFTLTDNQSGNILAQKYIEYYFPLPLINIQTISQAYTQAFNWLNTESDTFLKIYFN